MLGTLLVILLLVKVFLILSLMALISFMIILFEFFLIPLHLIILYQKNLLIFSLNIMGLITSLRIANQLMDPQHSVYFVKMSRLFYVIVLSDPIRMLCAT